MRATILRYAYLAATLATLSIGWFALSGDMVRVMEDTPSHRPVPPGFRELFTFLPGAVMVPFAAALVFLSFRPYWWGKLLCIWAGSSWIMFAMGAIAITERHAILPLPFCAGVVMLLVAVIHQIADPRFSGPYLRSA